MNTDELLQKRQQVAAWLEVTNERFDEKMRLMSQLKGTWGASGDRIIQLSKMSIPGYCIGRDTAEVRQQLIGALWMLDELIEELEND